MLGASKETPTTGNPGLLYYHARKCLGSLAPAVSLSVGPLAAGPYALC